MLAKMNISKCSFNILEAKITAHSSIARRREDFHKRFPAPTGALHGSHASSPVVAACDDVRCGPRSMTTFWRGSKRKLICFQVRRPRGAVCFPEADTVNPL